MKLLKRLASAGKRRLVGAAPEAPLWDHLDACGIPFRTPMADLISQYGSYPIGWSEALDTCTPQGHAQFIAGLAHQPTFQFSRDTDLLVPANYFFCAVQESADHRLNYAKAIHALVGLFGKGEPSSTSNTVAREWRFGHARLSCTVWPPERQDKGRNSRHDMFPETITEASITFTPAWRPPLSAEERAYCETAQPLDLGAHQSAAYGPVGPLTRDWPGDLASLPLGPAFAQDDAALLCATAPGLVDIVPRSWITAIALDRITGGRGGMEALVKLKFARSGQTHLPESWITLAYAHGDPHALDAQAEQLAARLGLEIKLYEGPSD